VNIILFLMIAAPPWAGALSGRPPASRASRTANGVDPEVLPRARRHEARVLGAPGSAKGGIAPGASLSEKDEKPGRGRSLA